MICSSWKPGILECLEFTGGIVKHTFQMVNYITSPIVLPDELAYLDGKVPIKQSKTEDLKKLRLFIPSYHFQFFDSTTSWPVSEDGDETTED